MKAQIKSGSENWDYSQNPPTREITEYYVVIGTQVIGKTSFFQQASSFTEQLNNSLESLYKQFPGMKNE